MRVVRRRLRLWHGYLMQEQNKAPSVMPARKRRRFQYSVRTPLLAITAASGWLSWQVWRTEQQMRTAVENRGLGGTVGFETQKRHFVWSLGGARLGSTAVEALVPQSRAATALPLLKSLPDLRRLTIWQDSAARRPQSGAVGHDEHGQKPAELQALREAFPNVMISHTVDFDDPTSLLLSSPAIKPLPWQEAPPTPKEPHLED